MIEEAINLIATDGSERQGAEVLMELAEIFKAGGQDSQLFLSVCMYIEEEASQRSDSAFVKLKLARVLHEMREERGRIILGSH